MQAGRPIVLLLSVFLIGRTLAVGQSPPPRPSVTLRASPHPPAARIQRAPVLGISPVPRLVPPPGPGDYAAAVNLVEAAGAGGHLGTWTWSALEPSRSFFELDDIRDTIVGVGDGHGFQLLLTIGVLNTNAKETPPDLMTVSFDAPQMKQRFHALVDAIRPLLTRRVAYLSIGNEVDVYLGAHPAEWIAYKSFYEDAAVYVRSVVPWIQVGVTATFSGASAEQAARVSDLNTKSDVVILTYYPLGSGFAVLPATSPLVDFPRMVALGGDRPVLLQEVGYPSSALLGSSESLQATFVTNVFTAWRVAGNRIPFLNFYELHEFTRSICDQLSQYYGLAGDTRFGAYLCTLGLRRPDGAPKPAWNAFTAGAAAR